MASITIRDNGCGVEPENLKKIFEINFSSKGAKGTGFGLAVSRKIAMEHKGRLVVDSELNVGSDGTISKGMGPRRVIGQHAA